MEQVKVIKHPTQTGCWTVAVTDDRGTAIYGSFKTRGQAATAAATY